MRNQPLCLLLLIVVVATIGFSHHHQGATAQGLGGRPKLGGFRPIEDVNDPHIREVGQYAVSENNRKSGNSQLVFIRVTGGEEQVVAGTNYRLFIDARDGTVVRGYVAVVYERPWENYKELTSFALRT